MQLPEAKHPWPMPVDPNDVTIEMVSVTSLLQRQAEWSVLTAHAIEPNPFLSWGFLVPLVANDLIPEDVQALVVSRKNETGVEMLGLALVRPRRKLSWRLGGRRAHRTLEIWRHPSQPFGGMLLAGGPGLAEAVLTRLFETICVPNGAFDALEFSALVAGSRLATLLATVIGQKRLSTDNEQRRPTTRGLNFLPVVHDPNTGDFQVETAVVAAARLLERMLVDEMTTTAEPSIAPLLSDVASTSFARAMVRGLSAEGQLMVVRSIDDGADTIGAIAIVDGEQTVLWRVMGQGLGNPEAEARMIATIRRQHDRPVVAGAGQTMTGIGLAALTLSDLRITGFAAQGEPVVPVVPVLRHVLPDGNSTLLPAE